MKRLTNIVSRGGSIIFAWMGNVCRILRSFGLIPELVGRLPVLTYMEPLGREALRSILTQPKNAIIKQYEKLFEMDGVKLVFDDEVLDYIVDKAIDMGEAGIAFDLCKRCDLGRIDPVRFSRSEEEIKWNIVSFAPSIRS